MLHALEKKKDVGYCWRLTGVRGSALLGERGGLNKKGSVLENGGEHCYTAGCAGFVF